MSDEPSHIPGWQRLDDHTTTSGRLTAADLPFLAALGTRSVINLALIDSPGALEGEAELVAAAGMAYTHIPVPFDAPQENHFAEFCQAIEASSIPVHVHCIANWRVSAFYYRYNRDVRNMHEAEARALMEQQWTPETNEAPGAAVWARFIAG